MTRESPFDIFAVSWSDIDEESLQKSVQGAQAGNIGDAVRLLTIFCGFLEDSSLNIPPTLRSYFSTAIRQIVGGYWRIKDLDWPDPDSRDVYQDLVEACSRRDRQSMEALGDASHALNLVAQKGRPSQDSHLGEYVTYLVSVREAGLKAEGFQPVPGQTARLQAIADVAGDLDRSEDTIRRALQRDRDYRMTFDDLREEPSVLDD